MYFIGLPCLFVKSNELRISELFTEVTQGLQFHVLPVTGVLK